MAITILLNGLLAAPLSAATPLPRLRAEAINLVDPAGKPVILKGCNLGNYLMFEGWMFGDALRRAGRPVRDGVTFERTLRRRFGEDKTRQLIDTFRAGWIAPRDFDLIKSFGFNVVRVPFDYRLIQEDSPPYRIRPDAFRWLDHVVDMAEAAGIYTILDLHGAPGGQSREDHTGEAGQNRLWTDETCQRRTVEIWRAVAGHFKGRTSVAAYDLLNEPYADHKQDVRPVLKTLMPAITRAIRDAGDSHVVYFPAPLHGGVAFYGRPHEQNLTNVAFTEHYYPGLFGDEPGPQSQQRQLQEKLPAKREELRRLAAPFLVGEFNPVLEANGGGAMLRTYYDRFAEYGWQATMWSYKLVKSDGGAKADAWYLVTNAEPLSALDIDQSSYEQLRAFVEATSTMSLAVDETRRDALVAPPR